MKILMVLEGIFPHDERVEKEALSLIGAGYEITVLCPTKESKSNCVEHYKDIRLWKVPSNTFMIKKASAACLTLPFYFTYWKKHISQILKEEKFDVIHVHDLPLSSLIQDIAEKYSIPVVLDFHENYPDMLAIEPRSQTLLGKLLIPISRWRKYERTVLGKASHVICVVEEMKKRLQKINAEPNYTVIENTLKIDLWAKPTILNNFSFSNEIRLVFVGGLTPKRGLDIAINGVAEFNKRHGQWKQCFLDIYGGGQPEYLNELQSLIVKNDLINQVSLKGFLKLPEEGNILFNYTAAIISNRRSVQTDYSSPNKLYQYLYQGLPILSSNCDSLKRFIKDNDAGEIYNHESPTDFSEMLMKLIGRKDFDKMRIRVHNLIKFEFNWDITAQHLISLYKNLETS